MTSADRRFRVASSVAKLGSRVALVGALGFATGQFYGWSMGATSEEMRASRLDEFLVLLFFGMTVGGLLVILSFSSVLYHRAARLAPPTEGWEQPPQPPVWIVRSLFVVVTAGVLVLLYVLVLSILAFFTGGAT